MTSTPETGKRREGNGAHSPARARTHGGNASNTSRARHGKGDGDEAASPATGKLRCRWRGDRRGSERIVPETDGSGEAVGSRDLAACSCCSGRSGSGGRRERSEAERNGWRDTWRWL